MRHGTTLPFEQRALSFDPTAITARIPGAKDHPVTGNGQREGIRCACPGHGASRAGLPDPAGDLPVTRRPASGDPAKLLPDPPLEGRAADVQGKVQTAPRRGDQLRHPAEPTDRFRIPLAMLLPVEPGLEGIDQRLPGIAEVDGAEAPPGAGDENPSEVGPRHGKADRVPLSPGPMRCALSHPHLQGTPCPIPRALLPMPIVLHGNGLRHPFLPQTPSRVRSGGEGTPVEARWNPPVFPSCRAGTMYTVCKFGDSTQR